MDNKILRQGEIHLRLHLHSLVPIHEILVDAMCGLPQPPLELATTLEDIGQRYLKMAEALNREIIDRGMIDDEPENADDLAETRIDRFATDLLAQAGVIVFHDGVRVDGNAALMAMPAVSDAIKAAVLVARARRGKTRSASLA